MAADAAVAAGDRPGAARDLATMAMYINRSPGIMATPHPAAEADALIAEATALSDGSLPTLAALVVTEWSDLSVLDRAQHTAELAGRSGDGILRSVALDKVTAVCLTINDIAEAVRTAGTRLDVLDTLAIGPLSGFEHADGRLMAAEVGLAAGDLAGAAAHADALAALPFYRDEDHLAISRRLLVDALAGRHDEVIRSAARFRAGWERAGRPVAPNLARAPYAVAMVYGMRGQDDRRADWVRMTIDIGIAPERLTGSEPGWPSVFDGLLALHRDDPAAALARLAIDIDGPEAFQLWSVGPWRPWHAALWAEAAVLAGHPDADARIARAAHVARGNRIAAAMVERARVIAAGDRDALVRLADTFAALGCPYQQVRTTWMVGRGSRPPTAG